MYQPIGQKLRQTREKRGLSFDEVTHATKLRPAQITALEIGDYASFPSNAYARSFLQIYGRYLGVDVSAEAATLDTNQRFNIEEYQYLTIPNEPREEPERDLPDLSRRAKPSLKPLLISAAAVVVAFIGFTNYVNWQRITGRTPAKVANAPAKPVAEAATPEPLPIVEKPAAEPVSIENPAPPVAAAPTEDSAPPAAPAAPAASSPPPVMVADREFLGEPAASATAASPAERLAPVPNPDRDQVAPTPVIVNEVEVSVATKTWVTIRRDDADAAPLFEDYLYPGVRPLKLKGSRFIIEARDPGVVEIRKNGAPIAYQRPGVTVQ
jgi:cytoskeletal protein RodZ